MLEINQGVVSPDGSLKVTIMSFDSDKGQGRLKIEEMHKERGRFYVTLKYGDAGQMRIDYKTYDVHKTSEYSFSTGHNDVLKEIEIVRVPAD